ncbi:hypothetical protein EJ08DRAFT_672921 [Tothia fuscella]|uniref:BZIP transcription factor n=1 Tax=Tothia fuscella TaxID=1048955 RepID=A0A9P4TT40_9PEZI|nr:hypothetical protein EJ08DRAFT_672921 [Tothia fuscella]
MTPAPSGSKDIINSASPTSSAPGDVSNAFNKRKRGGTSSRGVANLTPDQLERKRANDREAQRAIRERTKMQIDRLNARIHELESSQPYHDLQAVIAQKDAVLQENEEMKRQLASFVAVFQKWVPGAQGLDDLAAAAERNSMPFQPDQSAYAPPSMPAPDMISPDASAGSIASPEARHYQYSGMEQPQIREHPRAGWTPTDPNIHPDLAAAYNQSSDERLNVVFLLDSNHRIATSSNALPPEQNSARDTRSGPHSALPRHGEATCPLDALLLDFLAQRRTLAAQGSVTSAELVGPPYPNFNALLNGSTSHYNHPLSKVFTDILRTFPDLSNLPEQVAVVHIMFLVMRWSCEPTKENYDRMPEWIRPRPTQLFTVHPMWFDYLPWPRLRDAVIQTDPWPLFESFFIPYTTTLSVNWKYSPRDVLLPVTAPNPHPQNKQQSPGTSSNNSRVVEDSNEPLWKMNPVFESHILDLENWSLGPSFAEHFPDWASTVRIKRSGVGLGRIMV